MDLLQLIGRETELFEEDIMGHENIISELVRKSRFLVIGGAGSIGQAVVKELVKRDPRICHVIDINENNLVELVRDIRSSIGYTTGDFKTLAIDCGSIEFDAFITGNKYDYVLNFSALKHVRSEKDPFTLMRMIDVNIFNTEKTIHNAIEIGAKKYFCVSTDKATNPVNMMGASKRIMELFLMQASLALPVSTARFANVAFSDGSLLHGFTHRIQKKQPLSAPRDVKRYFMTMKESGELCLLSCLAGDNRDIFFPKLSEKLHLITFADIAVKYLETLGYEAYLCDSEEEARKRALELIKQRRWPCYFFDSDTTGEKDFEEFYVKKSTLDMNRFKHIGIIKNDAVFNNADLELFRQAIRNMKQEGHWTKQALVDLFLRILPDFRHKETGKYLDDRM